MPALRLADVTIDYEIRGESGPLVVQLHGLTSSRARDSRLGMDLGRVLTGHRVLRYDARGHGRSTGTYDEDSYHWGRLSGDLLQLLDHVAPGERVHGAGQSMGTGTLLHAAVRAPERFASLTLITPPTAWETRRRQADVYRAHADVVQRRGIDAFVALDADSAVPPALVGRPETRPDVSADLLPTVLRGAATADLPAPADIAGIRLPTLILAWAGDPQHPMSTANRLHELIAGSSLEVAHTPYGIMAWPGLFAEHVAMHDPAVDAARAAGSMAVR